MSYAALEKITYRLSQIEHANSFLGWDTATFMPNNSSSSRGLALAELSVLSTEIIQDPKMPDLFAAAEQDADRLEPWQRANLCEMKERWKKATAVPKELVEAKAIATNKAEHAWRTMRSDNNWDEFEPLQQTVFDLCKEEAQALNDALKDEKSYVNEYEALLDIYDPGTRLSRVDKVFNELKVELPRILQQVTEKQKREGHPIKQAGPVNKDKQIALAKNIMDILGFDFSAGRLDETAHPFSGGTPDDSRITTRYDVDNVVEGLMGIIHETGHSRYETGLRADWRHKAIGTAMGMGVHESQSLFFEMQMGRSKPFIRAISPIIRQHLGEDPAFSANNMEKLYTHVEPGLIRVQADEVTYPLHVVIRYEIERDVILGKLKVSDIPERWNTGMKEYLGIDTRGDFNNGPMQDIHWPLGLVGYFPSYTLGAMTAAQLHASMVSAMPNAPQLVEALELKPIFDWLSENIWQKGRLLNYDQLMTAATGDTLNSSFFLQHIRNRYL